MKERILNFLNPGTYTNSVNIALLILRVIIGVFMIKHGLGKLETLFGNEPIEFPDPIGVGATASLALAVFSEVFCSVLLLIGLCTRFAAIPLFITMMVAAYIVHLHDGFNKQELALLYALIYIVITLIGAGKYSLDHMLFKQRKQ